MDIQIKRGLLDVCVLSALRWHESYGYRIVKSVKSYVEISESTLYPILKRLENAGQVTVRSAEHNGRLRKYYSITETGLEKIKAFNNEWSEIIAIYNYVNREEDENEEE